jgi:hypothetical protein
MPAWNPRRQIVSFPRIAEEPVELDGRPVTKEIAMRILAAAIVIGPLTLIGALSASAGQSIPSDAPPIRLIAGTNAPADRDTYTREVRHEMQEWQRKLHDFNESAAAKGKEAATAVESDLSTAWIKADAASRDLQTVGAEGWESAKVAFNSASRDLAAAWHKVHPEDK